MEPAGGDQAVNVEINDERRTAPVVREFSSERRKREQKSQDRRALARVLHAAGMENWEIAEVIGVHWAQVDPILKGER
jgi:hypothetical protein